MKKNVLIGIIIVIIIIIFGLWLFNKNSCSYYEDKLDPNNDWDRFLFHIEVGDIESIHLNSPKCSEYFAISLKEYPQGDLIYYKQPKKGSLNNALEECGDKCEDIVFSTP